jgi:hypothetical protein
VPELEGASSFFDELTALSDEYGVTVTSLSLASASIYVDPAAASTTATAPAADTGTTASTPTGGTPGLVLIPVLMTVTGPFDNVRDFIGAAQEGTRLFFVSGASIAVSGTDASASLTGDVFSLQGTSDPVKKAKVAAVPATTATATPTPTLTPTPTPTATTTKAGTTTKTTPPPVAPTTAPTPTPTPTDSTGP